jgi:outer membrane protein, heavy metal efflux system
MRHVWASFGLAILVLGGAGWVGLDEARAEPAPADTAAPVRQLLLDTRALGRWIVQHNREVAAALARVDQARADAGGSRLFLNPALDFAMAQMPVGPENSGYPRQGFANSTMYTVGLSQTIELGKRGPRIASAQLLLEATRLAYVDTFIQKIAEARVALGRVAYLKAKQAMLEERLSSAREVLALEKSRLKQGFMSSNDYDRLVLDTMTVEARTARNLAELDAALQVCGAALFSTCSPATVQDSDIDNAAPVPAKLPDLEAALARRPDIQALERARLSALQDAKGARRRAIPDLTVRLGYLEDRLVVAGNQPHTMQLGLAVPLPVFNRGQFDAAKARARAGEIELTADTVLRRARAEAQALVRRKTYVSTTLDRLETAAVPRSKALVASSLKAFNAGQFSTTDLLAVRRTHLALMITVHDLEFEFFSVRSELRRALALDGDVARELSPAHQ